MDGRRPGFGGHRGAGAHLLEDAWVPDQMTPEQLAACLGVPAARAQTWADPLSAAMALYAIDSPARQAAFVAQVGHESGRLVYVKELWGPTGAQAGYEGRHDLGNTEPGDGPLYCGRG